MTDHMNHMTPPAEVLRRMADEGYETNLWVDENGSITSGSDTWSPDRIVVGEIARFEGQSDPGDETIILAVDLDGQPLGALSLPYGSDVSPAQAETVRRLHQASPDR